MQPHPSIIITGGGGMLAHALAQRLRARGMEYVAVDRSQCDVTRADDLEGLFKTYRPTLLFNCAAHTRVDQCEDEPERAAAINGRAPGEMARLCRQHGTRLVHYSTDFVFDGQSDRPYRPGDPTSPLSAYGRTKLEGEQRLQEYAPSSWLIVRTSWLFGQHGSCFPKTIVQMARAGRAMRVVDDQFGSPTHTIDLAEATLSLMDKNACGIFHVSNSQTTSWYGFAKATLQAFGLSAGLEPTSTRDWLTTRPRQAVRPAYSAMDCSEFVEVTGQELRPWTDALRDYRDAVRTAGEV
jgi:dTDP-4-dehydrorhamnose reductase